MKMLHHHPPPSFMPGMTFVLVKDGKQVFFKISIFPISKFKFIVRICLMKYRNNNAIYLTFLKQYIHYQQKSFY